MKYILFILFMLITFESYASDFIETKKDNNITPSGAIGICDRYVWFCSNYQGKEISIKDAKKINRLINQSSPIEDIKQYGDLERWALLTNKGGDCEDYVLSKMKMFIDNGYDSRGLFLAIVITKTKGIHAVLVLRNDDGDYVLDNLTNRIVRWRETKYKFLVAQDLYEKDKWYFVK